jgi:hypothetical protein
MIKVEMESLSSFFRNIGLKTSLLPANEEQPTPLLSISLPPIIESTERHLLIKIESNPEKTEETVLADNQKLSVSPHYFIQFFSGITTLSKEEAFGDVARSIFMANRLINLPGFSFDEQNRLLYYRHLHVVSKQEIEKETLLLLFGSIVNFIDLFTISFDELCQGKITFSESVELAFKE